MFIELAKGVALLLALSLLQSFVLRHWRHGELVGKIVSGSLFGVICIIGMQMPIEIEAGIIFDARTVVLSMSGLFGGPVVGIIAATIAGSYRAWLGGVGADIGVAAVISAMLMGLLYRYCQQKGWVKVEILQLLAFGLIVQIMSIFLLSQLPTDHTQQIVEKLSIPMILVFTPAAAFLGWLLDDINRRIAIEKSLAESETRFKGFAESTSDWFWETGPDHRFTKVYGPALDRLGFDVAEYIGELRTFNVDVNSEPERWAAHLDDLDHHRSFRDFVVKRKSRDDEARWVKVSGQPFFDDAGKFKGYRGTGTDITELLNAEKQKQLSYSRLSDAIESLSEGFILFDKEDRIVICNNSYRSMYPFLGKHLEPGTSFDDLARAIASSGLIPESRADPEGWLRDRAERHRNPKDPFIVKYEDGTSILVNEFKTVDGGTALIRSDVTWQAKLEKDLHESEDQFRSLFEQSPMGIGLEDYSGVKIIIDELRNKGVDDLRKYFRDNPKVLYQAGKSVKTIDANDALLQMHNVSGFQEYSEFEADIESWWMSEETDEYFINAVSSLAGDDRGYSDYHFLPKGTDAPVYASSNSRVMKGSENSWKNVISIYVDITERKRIQAQLNQSSKLASLGEMAMGIAHEINQPLHVIRLAVNNINRKLGQGRPDPEYLKNKLDKIENQIDRTTLIIDRMRVFGRRPEDQSTTISPRAAVLNAVEFIGEQYRLLGIDLQLDIPDQCRSTMGELIQLEQVILNLLGNARDAIEAKEGSSGGTPGPDVVKVRIEDDLDVDVIRIVVEDTGGGIPESVLPHVFDPFITTKDVGKGTGIGLSISYGIINELGGGITAHNINGGAMFVVSVPAVDDAEVRT